VRAPGPSAQTEVVDAFDLPEWVGEADVVWCSEVALDAPWVPGRLAPEQASDGAGLACDLLACDRAHPEPALPEGRRREAHAQWALHQVLLLDIDGRLTLVCPGVDVELDTALESLRRLAKAVGVPSSRFTAALRL
jgi:hypothetical protein